ncbi:MAG TPA: hypothetical protein PLV72_02215 [Candidatus Magasanikbacteria bacterium]|nr:hypothetical protein [Candidatus Magasanikbacteria bacterium]
MKNTPQAERNFLPGFEMKPKNLTTRENIISFSPHIDKKTSEIIKPKTDIGTRLTTLFDGKTTSLNLGDREKWGEPYDRSQQHLIDAIYELTPDEDGPAIIILKNDPYLYFVDAVAGQQTLFRIKEYNIDSGPKAEETEPKLITLEEIKNILADTEKDV